MLRVEATAIIAEPDIVATACNVSTDTLLFQVLSGIPFTEEKCEAVFVIGTVSA